VARCGCLGVFVLVNLRGRGGEGYRITKIKKGKMEMTLDGVLAVLGLLLGGGSGAFFTWRWQRAKAKAEAESAEVAAVKELQDVYQQMIADVKSDRDEQKTYIQELKEDRRHLRDERNELRERIDKTDEAVRALQREVARNGRMVECMRPLLCGRQGCADRVSVTISAEGEVEERPTPDPSRQGGEGMAQRGGTALESAGTTAAGVMSAGTTAVSAGVRGEGTTAEKEGAAADAAAAVAGSEKGGRVGPRTRKKKTGGDGDGTEG
jgi:hypothetical protein